MRLKLTAESITRYKATKRQRHSDLFGRYSPYTQSAQDDIMLYSQITPKIYDDTLAVLKLPKVKATDDQWYHLVHCKSGLVIGRMQWDQVSDARKMFFACKWYYLASDQTRSTLVAVYGNNCRTTFYCPLRYEEVTE